MHNFKRGVVIWFIVILILGIIVCDKDENIVSFKNEHRLMMSGEKTMIEIYEGIYRDAPDLFRAIAYSGKPKSNGYVGSSGELHVGGNRALGLYLIYGAVTDDISIINEGFECLDLIFSRQHENGFFFGVGPHPGDALSSTCFFLNICQTFLALEELGDVNISSRIDGYKPQILKAANFARWSLYTWEDNGYKPILEDNGEIRVWRRWEEQKDDEEYTGHDVQRQYNSRNSNRFAWDAGAYGFAGILLDDRSLKKYGRSSMNACFNMQEDNGVYLEADGSGPLGYDSSYQAVTCGLIFNYSLGFDFYNTSYYNNIEAGFDWLLSRINKETGEVLTEGNTRCGPGKKPMSYSEIIMCLLVAAQVYNEPEITDLAEQVVAYVRSQ